MSDNHDKMVLLSRVTALGAFCSNKAESVPTTREACEEDRKCNEDIRSRALEIKNHKFFKNLIIEYKTHEEFLDIWEQLEYFVNKWAFPYQVLNELEWKMEDDDLYGIGEALMSDVKVV